MFVLKKIISALLYPLPVCLLILFAGVLLLWIGKKKTWGRRLVTTGFVLLLLLSFGLIPNTAVRALEGQYDVFTPALYPEAEVKWVVVLSGGVRDVPAFPPHNQISTISLARLIEGVRILQLYPEARLLLTGGGYFSNLPEAVAMQGVTEFLGVDPERVRLETGSIDTADQAASVKLMVGQEALVLVTSATHLPRAMALFEQQGMQPFPAPAAHLLRPQGNQFSTFFPSSGHLGNLQTAWHEYMGLLWGRLTGQL